MIRLPIPITDSTGGSASATREIDDTTASVKDDLATLAAAVNDTHTLARALARRLLEAEEQ